MSVAKYCLALCAVFSNTPASAGEIFSPVLGDSSTTDGGLSRGAAFGDLDNDGDPDLVVANTINYPEFLYQNDGGSFVQVMETEPSLAGGFSEGVSLIDFDNDGDLDIFVVRTKGVNGLYRNDGDWLFTEHQAGGLVSEDLDSSMACWADFDNDGWLDVFVVNRGGRNDSLFQNLGGQQFRRISHSLAVKHGGDGRSCTAADFNGDGKTDLYVGNFIDHSTDPHQRQQNVLLINRGQFEFSIRNHDPSVTAHALTYGTSAMDADNDGDLDLLVTNIGINDDNQLYLNDGDGNFHLSDSGLSFVEQPASKGHTWGDFDLDGDVDLAIANGTEGTMDVTNMLFLNDGGGKLTSVKNGAFVTNQQISAGIANADIDNDGDLDLYVTNWRDSDEDNALYRNESSGSWLKLSLVGVDSNRMGVGAKVSVIMRSPSGKREQHRWQSAATGYASQNEPVVHFGLGDATNIDQLKIRWPSGRVDALFDIDANQHIVVTEGQPTGDSRIPSP